MTQIYYAFPKSPFCAMCLHCMCGAVLCEGVHSVPHHPTLVQGRGDHSSSPWRLDWGYKTPPALLPHVPWDHVRCVGRSLVDRGVYWGT